MRADLLLPSLIVTTRYVHLGLLREKENITKIKISKIKKNKKKFEIDLTVNCPRIMPLNFYQGAVATCLPHLSQSFFSAPITCDNTHRRARTNTCSKLF